MGGETENSKSLSIGLVQEIYGRKVELNTAPSALLCIGFFLLQVLDVSPLTSDKTGWKKPK